MTDLTVVLGVVAFAKQSIDFSNSNNFRIDVPDDRVTEFSRLLFPILADPQHITYVPSEPIDIRQYESLPLQAYVQSLIQTLNLRSLLTYKNQVHPQEYKFGSVCWAKLLKIAISTAKLIEAPDKEGLILIKELTNKLKTMAESWYSETDSILDVRRRQLDMVQCQEIKTLFNYFFKKLHDIRPAAMQILHEFFYLANQMIFAQKDLLPGKKIDLESMAMLISPCILDALQLRGHLHAKMINELYFFGQISKAILQIEIFKKEYQSKYFGIQRLDKFKHMEKLSSSLMHISSSTMTVPEPAASHPRAGVPSLQLDKLNSQDDLSPSMKTLSLSPPTKAARLECSPKLLFSIGHQLKETNEALDLSATQLHRAAIEEDIKNKKKLTVKTAMLENKKGDTPHDKKKDKIFLS